MGEWWGGQTEVGCWGADSTGQRLPLRFSHQGGCTRRFTTSSLHGQIGDPGGKARRTHSFIENSILEDLQIPILESMLEGKGYNTKF